MQETSIRPRSILQFRQDIEVQLRRHIGKPWRCATEELAAALASQPYERREGRCGYRHGTTERTITTPDGPSRSGARGRLIGPDGASQEFHSRLVPRYSRRTVEIDEAILGCYLGGINSRRIRTALKPLLGERHLSKSAVSRIVARLKALFTTWQGRELSAERNRSCSSTDFISKYGWRVGWCRCRSWRRSGSRNRPKIVARSGIAASEAEATGARS